MNEHINRLNELREKHPRATRELDLLSGRVDKETGLLNTDHEPEEMQEWIELDVLEVIDLIAQQGHSGFSHGYMLSLLIPLLKDLPITPLTGKDWEWGTGAGDDQNNRCSKVFRRKDRTAYNIDGYAFSDNGGKTWYRNKNSWKDITFPCKSKDLETVYICKEES